MMRYAVLLKFTASGVEAVKDSIERADGFRKRVEQAGGKLDAVYWTTGPYDGMFVLSAPDETTAAALVLGLDKSHHVQTCMLRAFDAEEFKGVVDMLG